MQDPVSKEYPQFNATAKGIVVKINPRIELPGVFLGMLAATRAYDQYMAKTRTVKLKKGK